MENNRNESDTVVQNTLDFNYGAGDNITKSPFENKDFGSNFMLTIATNEIEFVRTNLERDIFMSQ